METPDWPFAVLALASLIVATLALRMGRTRTVRTLLRLPAHSEQFTSKRGRASLPPNLDLASNAPLFNVLHDAFRKRPQLFLHTNLHDSLDKVGSLEAPRLEPATTAATSATDEERINHWMSLRSYPGNPDAVPYDAFASSLLRNFIGVLKGQKKLKIGVEHAVVDSMGVGAGMAGAKMASLASVATAPLWAGFPPFALPAFILLGAWSGSLVGRKIGHWIKARRLHGALRKLNRSTLELKAGFLRQLPHWLEEMDAEYQERQLLARTLQRKQQGLLLRTLFPNLMSVFFKDCVTRLKSERRSCRRDWKALRRRIQRSEPREVASLLEEMHDSAIEPESELHRLREAHALALKELEETREQAS